MSGRESGSTIMVWTSAVVVWAMFLLTPEQKNDTDPPTGSSGLHVYIDAATGCHFRAGLGMSQRLGMDGKPMCAHDEYR